MRSEQEYARDVRRHAIRVTLTVLFLVAFLYVVQTGVSL